VDGRIAESSKLLIWSENTRQKKKTKRGGGGVGAGRRRGSGEEEGAYLLSPPLKSVF
jgi:hypothetical protein